METSKLTLSIPKKLLFEAKAYSKKTGKPLSRLVSRYFQFLSASAYPTGDQAKISSKVAKVTGLAKSHLSDDELKWKSMAEKFL